MPGRSSWHAWGGRGAVLLAAIALAGLAGAGARPGVRFIRLPAERAGSIPYPASLAHDTALSPSRLARATMSWRGGPVTASTGEVVTIYVSNSFTDAQASVQAWANLFAGLVHGSELSSLAAYVGTLAEVQQICGDQALGCYGSNTLVTIGETAGGTSAAEVASHEYGHHVASNRDDSPWSAVAWGAKRWASRENVCVLTSAGSLFPGDEADHYRLNPGEGFAEAYRALIEWKHGGTSFDWQIVDGGFYPDEGDLQAVEQDVVQPWAGVTSRVAQGRFLKKGPKVWSLPLVTPLDGLLTLSLSLPKGTLYTLSLVGPDRKTVLAIGLWSGANLQTLSFTVCGQRSLLVRVVRAGAAGRFTLALSQP